MFSKKQAGLFTMCTKRAFFIEYYYNSQFYL